MFPKILYFKSTGNIDNWKVAYALSLYDRKTLITGRIWALADFLRNLVPFVQVKKHENHPSRKLSQIAIMWNIYYVVLGRIQIHTSYGMWTLNSATTKLFGQVYQFRI